ncbi:hypothetical protein RVR_P239 (plasmid) [Actinacidiphila reveromycinica]|uniref:Histidine kinase/HSP90-like ATPase domain-containing protein n=1 Tax=Actinacidiphila reveromycinica TaxID=659352 RepID=A0A7R6QEF0_9ACTN|nr:ATP-binding protein [Streptomyces sp. SN-593]BBG20781.1 hypothetical protein RVR_P239 [Streptomyces sp. SN-593]
MQTLDRIAFAAQRFAREPRQVGNARRWASRVLSTWGIEQIDTIVVCMSELATNAVLYGAGAQVRVQLTGSSDLLRVEVHDLGSGRPHQRCPSPMDERGRGLLLVAALARQWAVEPEAVGNVVWAEFGVSYQREEG